MKLKPSFSEYTKEEFLLLMKEIIKENTAPTDKQLDKLLQHFELITEHPEETDLIYYAPSDAESTIEAITERVEKWREANGKPGFKEEYPPKKPRHLLAIDGGAIISTILHFAFSPPSLKLQCEQAISGLTR